MYLKYFFMAFALLLAVMLSIYKLIIQKRERTEKTAEYLSCLTGSFAFYIFMGIVLACFIEGRVNKTIVILFALSPFIIGKFATYQKETLYSIIQIVCAIISAGYVYFI